MNEAWLVLTLLLVLTTPGAALLSVTNSWQHWRGLQRVAVLVGLSISSYPVLFYFLKLSPVALPLGPYKVAFGLLLCWIFVTIKEKRQSLDLFRFQRNELLPLFVLVLTLFTRLWVAHQIPYPAWTDSVHHVMLTKLIAVNGLLPSTLEPYYPIPLSMYHLGLHSIAAIVAWIAQVPFHSALLWTAQTLNGLCGLGVYFVLDRKAGKLAAITGALVAGIFSYQPAFYVNWGRFTQVAGQSLLLISWLITYEAISMWADRENRMSLRNHLVLAFLCALMTAGMFLIHFRVAAFYVLLLGPSILYLLWRHRKTSNSLLWVCIGVISIGVVTIILVSPGFFEAVRARIQNVSQSSLTSLTSVQSQEVRQGYFEAPFTTILDLTAQRWLLLLFAGCALTAIVTRNRLAGLNLLWMFLLCGLGNTYWLGIPLLNIVNFTGTVIMFYLPISLVIGCAAAELFTRVAVLNRPAIKASYFVCLIALSLPLAYQRVIQLEPYRYFVTDADMEAMNWINQNVPLDAIFAVNTDFWLPSVPLGTDAGYWIPYFTERQITAAAMLTNLANPTYRNKSIELSREVVQLNDNVAAFDILASHRVCYIYMGAKGDYRTGGGFNADQLIASKHVQLLYNQGGVMIFHINSIGPNDCNVYNR